MAAKEDDRIREPSLQLPWKWTKFIFGIILLLVETQYEFKGVNANIFLERRLADAFEACDAVG